MLSPILFDLYIDPLATQVNLDTSPNAPNGLFFADDVSLYPTTPLHASILLNVCYSWSEQMRLKWNPSKCGSINNSTPFQIGGSLIPIVTTFKFLGVPFDSRGALWLTHFCSLKRKTETFLKSLDSNAWSYRARLVIFKTFIRPLFEYCLSLVYLWAKLDAARLKEFLGCYKQLMQQCLQFVFITHRSLDLLHSLSGLGSLTFRLEYLISGLSRHIDAASASNPLLALISSTLSANTHQFLLPLVKKAPLYLEFKQFNQAQQSSRFKTTYRSWALQQRAESMNHVKSQSKLLWYAYDRLINNDLSDCVFRFPQDLIKSAMQWRLGVLWINRKCVCGKSVNRRHITECILIDSPVAVSIKRQQFFRDSVTSLRASLTTEHFSVLDAALNVNHSSSFRQLTSYIESKLGHDPA